NTFRSSPLIHQFTHRSLNVSSDRDSPLAMACALECHRRRPWRAGELGETLAWWRVASIRLQMATGTRRGGRVLGGSLSSKIPHHLAFDGSACRLLCGVGLGSTP